MNTFMRINWIWVSRYSVAIAAAIALSGCIPKNLVVGAECTPSESACKGPDENIVCRNGHLFLFSCPGPKGCFEDQSRTVTCDQSKGMKDKDLCLDVYDGKAHCSKNRDSYLQCKTGAWFETKCDEGTRCADDAGVLCQKTLND